MNGEGGTRESTFLFFCFYNSDNACIVKFM